MWASVEAAAMADQPLILVVDDDPIILLVTSRHLTEGGYRVLTAPDGQEAWELIQGPPSLQADLMLIDVRMPRMGGAELGRLVGISRPEIPVLYMTGFVSTVEWELPEDVRRTRLLLKPFTGAALLGAVGSWMSRRLQRPPR
jgi:CheY-like chemotaxis protein